MFFAIVQRLWQMLFVMFGISVMVFLIFFATPGADPASRIAGRGASPEILEAVRGDVMDAVPVRPHVAGDR